MKKIVLTAFVFVASLGLSVPQAIADPWDQTTVFTFSGPVQIPGRELNAGTYVFKIENSMADRDVVQVFNADRTHLLGTFLAVPDYRLKPAGKPIVTFSEQPAGTPEEVRAWFYPGENYGHEFVYPRPRAAQLAKANHQAVASTDESSTDDTTIRKAHVKAQQPTGDEVEVPDAFGVPPAESGTRK